MVVGTRNLKKIGTWTLWAKEHPPQKFHHCSEGCRPQQHEEATAWTFQCSCCYLREALQIHLTLRSGLGRGHVWGFGPWCVAALCMHRHSWLVRNATPLLHATLLSLLLPQMALTPALASMHEAHAHDIASFARPEALQKQHSIWGL